MSDDQRTVYLESAHDAEAPEPVEIGASIAFTDDQGRVFRGTVTEAWPEDDEYIFVVPGCGRMIAARRELSFID